MYGTNQTHDKLPIDALAELEYDPYMDTNFVFTDKDVYADTTRTSELPIDKSRVQLPNPPRY